MQHKKVHEKTIYELSKNVSSVDDIQYMLSLIDLKNQPSIVLGTMSNYNFHQMADNVFAKVIKKYKKRMVSVASTDIHVDYMWAHLVITEPNTKCRIVIPPIVLFDISNVPLLRMMDKTEWDSSYNDIFENMINNIIVVDGVNNVPLSDVIGYNDIHNVLILLKEIRAMCCYDFYKEYSLKFIEMVDNV